MSTKMPLNTPPPSIVPFPAHERGYELSKPDLSIDEHQWQATHLLIFTHSLIVPAVPHSPTKAGWKHKNHTLNISFTSIHCLRIAATKSNIQKGSSIAALSSSSWL
ncbi:hypothetical protein CS022_00670 [Veronia nyctiphanis]|uniref:Uncharacterized protein n=1 Tax=Veronia nyctiphanis TaxID=1278244 RepID=A0A4Q0YV80_9GAMM|nr:hypothetical protein CS022_00670 [Veronia nyctiphanis]